MRNLTTTNWYVSRRSTPAQTGVEPVGSEQLPDPGDPLEPGPGEVGGGQPVLLERLVELLDALADGPAQLQPGHARHLGAVHPVAAQVRPGALGEGDLAARDDLADHLGDLADAVVLLGPAHVEGLVVDDLA